MCYGIMGSVKSYSIFFFLFAPKTSGVIANALEMWGAYVYNGAHIPAP